MSAGAWTEELQAFAGRRVLVTGHTGFKGAWLCAWLLRLGAQVCGFSNDVLTEPSLSRSIDLEHDLRHEVGDIRDTQRLERLLADFQPDFVFHLAAQAIVSLAYTDPLETVSTNVLGTACVLQACRVLNNPAVVLVVTSDKCYDNVEQPWGYREIDALGGRDVYSASKGAAEIITHSFWRSFFAGGLSDVRVVTARAGNVLGGGDWAADRIVADCVRAWLKDEVVMLRRPSATRPWQHVLEPLGGYLLLASKVWDDATLDGEAFNFGPRAEQNRTVLELMRDLSATWGFSAEDAAFKALPDPPFHEAGLLKLNCDKALLRLGWAPTLRYSECVRLTGEWYRQVHKENRPARQVTMEQLSRYEALAQKRVADRDGVLA